MSPITESTREVLLNKPTGGLRYCAWLPLRPNLGDCEVRSQCRRSLTHRWEWSGASPHLPPGAHYTTNNSQLASCLEIAGRLYLGVQIGHWYATDSQRLSVLIVTSAHAAVVAAPTLTRITRCVNHCLDEG